MCLVGLAVDAVPAWADYKSEVGFYQLQAELGTNMPTGNGVTVTQVEAPEGSNYLPDANHPEFSGKTLNARSGAGAASSHATFVAQHYFGNFTSLSPGVKTIDAYEANDWITGGFLRMGLFLPPRSETRAIQNHSWIGYDSGNSNTVEIVRRYDYAIQTSGFLGVAGLNNNSGSSIPPLLGESYNGLVVGLTSGAHSSGSTSMDGAGRVKPDLVAPFPVTSLATPVVASAAALLLETARSNAPLSLATNPVVLKALLLAGANKSPFTNWNRTVSRPLDAHFGAGELNIYNSHQILRAGRQTNFTTATRRGWDYSTTTGAGRLYFFEIPSGQTNHFSVALTWQRVISSTLVLPSWGNPTSSLANLNLRLYQATDFSLGAMIDASESPVDNVEHLFQPLLPPGRYALEISADQENIPYGIAWLSLPTVSLQVTQPHASELGPTNAVLVVTRSGDTNAVLTVLYSVSGIALNGVDYAWVPGSLTISAGATSANLVIAPLADSLAEGPETLTVKLTGHFNYGLGLPKNGEVNIADLPFDAWRFGKFSSNELQQAQLSGPGADFDGDGAANLLEYALDLEPKISDSAGLPEVALADDGSLSLTFTRVKTATDIQYLPEVSTNLSVWFSGPPYTTVLTTTDHGATETVKVGSQIPAQSTTNQVMRLRVVRP